MSKFETVAFDEALYELAVPARDSHVALLLGMTRQAGAAVHQSACAVECSPTGRSGSAATLACAVDDRATKPAACKAVTDRRYRRNWRVPF